MYRLKPLQTLALLLILTSSCVQSRPIALQSELPELPVPAKTVSPVALPLFNHTVPLIGADDTRGVIRFTQKPGDNIITLNVYAHDLPADHHYTLQYAISHLQNAQAADSDWMNAGNANTAFDMEADRTGAIIEEYRMNAEDIVQTAVFDIRFQLRDHTSEVVLSSDLIHVAPND